MYAIILRIRELEKSILELREEQEELHTKLREELQRKEQLEQQILREDRCARNPLFSSSRVSCICKCSNFKFYLCVLINCTINSLYVFQNVFFFKYKYSLTDLGLFEGMTNSYIKN